jgi:hypothetical protein
MNPEDEKQILIESLVVLAQGNIGALQCLMEILKSDPIFLNPLSIALILTKSKSYALWLVYRDICKRDVESTKNILRDWFDNSTEPLEKWLEVKGERQ